jgi:carbonic anhydrase/acetyltransferase-like protein (isoleucine patch superfamily)
VIPDGSVVIGNPYVITRSTTQDEIDYIIDRCDNYTKVANMYKRTANIL